ncbi:MAG TPA: rhomboid family intramembrane serine protease [Ferruginibacter sp.]|nr:rhomboid family intramembrane serine protease [Ferruginibacter sp.]
MNLSITVFLIIITVGISLLAFNKEEVMDKLIFYPPAISERNGWYRFISCGFIHADVPHLVFNMYALYLFGSGVESRFTGIFAEKGKLLYLLMYITALAASILPTYLKNKTNYHYRSLGASGAVSAVVFCFMLFEPLIGIGLVFIPVYISGFLFGIIYLAVSYALDKRGGGRINHSAHIWGALYGLVFVIVCCKFFADYAVLEDFIEKIKNIDPSQIIRFGGGQTG